MAITNETRQHLFQLFESIWSREEAVMMMEHLPPVDWIHIARRDDLERLQTALGTETTDLGTTLRAGMVDFGTAIRAEMADLGTTLRAEMAQQGELLRWEMTAGSATLRAEVAMQSSAIRSEMAALSTDVAELRSEMRTGLAQNELYVTRLFSDFRAQIDRDNRTTSRQIMLALVVALISMVVATAGLG